MKIFIWGLFFVVAYVVLFVYSFPVVPGNVKCYLFLAENFFKTSDMNKLLHR